MQQKTHRPVQFEITEETRESLTNWIVRNKLLPEDALFKSRFKSSEHLSTRQYARIVAGWVAEIGLDPTKYGTHSLRRTKATPDISPHAKSQGSPVVTGALQLGKYSPLPRH